MPILVKPIGNPNEPTDGFDPEARYQMVPFGKTRQVSAQTGSFEAEMKFDPPNISSMSNFRLVRQTPPSTGTMPPPNARLSQVILPSNSIIEFTLVGGAPGTTHLEGRDLPGSGAPPLAPDFKLEVAVKEAGRRRLAVCYVFDQINGDSGQRVDFGGLFADVSRIFEQQSNYSIVNIDGNAARILTLAGTMGRTFDLFDSALMARLINGFETNFPGVFAQTSFVLFAMPVPLQAGRRRPLALQINLHRTLDGAKFNTLFLSPTRGMNAVALRRTLAHETGHTFGLNHNPREQPSGPQPNTLPDPDVLPLFMHNLMFPTDLVPATRLTRGQIENIHSFIPPFRDLDF